MRKAIKFLCLGFVLLLAGCGLEKIDASTTENDNSNNGGIVVGEMEPTLQEIDSLVYEYKIKNQTEQEVKLDFTSSQRYDFSIKDNEGKQIYLFSSLALFLQVEGQEVVKQGEELVYTINVNEIGLSPGTYTLTAWLTPKEGKKFETSTKFIVN